MEQKGAFSRVQNFPYFIYLFPLYPILHLYAENYTLLDLRGVVEVAAITLVIITVIFGALWAVFRSIPRASGLTLLGAILFFSYGHIYNYYEDSLGVHLNLGHKLFFPAAIVVFVIAALLVLKFHEAFGKAAFFLNMTTLVLLVFPVINILSLDQSTSEARTDLPDLHDVVPTAHDVLPDIYYIILDGYNRADWLQERFDFDNSAFIDALTGRGFYVAPRSCSNYEYTSLSLPSTLSMQYFDTEAYRHYDRRELYLFTEEYFRDNNWVGRMLTDWGYTYVHFSSGFDVLESSPESDIWLDFGPDGTFTPEKQPANAFINVLLPTTLYTPFFDPLAVTTGQAYGQNSPQRILDELAELKRIPDMADPTFTFAHILKPHFPYIFDRDGNILPKPAGWQPSSDQEDPEADKLYVEQVLFINQRILDVIDTILAESAVTPIIILQGDHGMKSQHTGPDENPSRTPILNAYLVPPETQAQLYPSITPINSFRVLFDTFFGTDLGLLEDHSYYSNRERPLRFTLLTPEEWPWCGP